MRSNKVHHKVAEYQTETINLPRKFNAIEITNKTFKYASKRYSDRNVLVSYGGSSWNIIVPQETLYVGFAPKLLLIRSNSIKGTFYSIKFVKIICTPVTTPKKTLIKKSTMPNFIRRPMSIIRDWVWGKY